MNLRVTNNLAASIVLGGMRSSTAAFSSSAERLSTGLRVNHASDDAPRFVGINVLRTQLADIGAALENVQIADSTLGIAQDGMTKVYDYLVKLRSLAVKSLTVEYGSNDKATIQDEAEYLLSGIDRVARDTQLGGNRVLDGSGDFYIEKTDGAFDDIRIKRTKFNAGADHREVTMDVTRLAERATIVTNLDLASTANLTSGSQSVLSIGGKLGSTQIAVTPDMSARDIVEQVNSSAKLTGVYASSAIVNAAESLQTLAFGDLELTGGSGFQVTVSISGGGSTTVNGTATGDKDNDANPDITADDLANALNSANLGHFSVIGGDDAGAGNRNFMIRHAGANDFDLTFGNGSGTISAVLAALTVNGTEPANARLISDGLSFNATTGPVNFNVMTVTGNAAQTRTVTVTGTTANYNDGAELAAVIGSQVGVTYLGVNGNGKDIFLFEAGAGVDAFAFSESGAGSTARDIGLLSDSGGGNGLASKGMAVLALYSDDFGSDQSISMRNASDSDLRFNNLNQSSSGNSGLTVGASISGFGVDVQARIGSASILGRGFHVNYSSDSISFSADLAPRFGKGSETNALNTVLNLDYADPTALDYNAMQPVSKKYEGKAFMVNERSDSYAQDLDDQGVVDRVSFSVYRSVPNSTARSGLGVQLTDQWYDREYIGIRSFDTSNLGGLPSTESEPGTESNRLLMGAGTLSQIRRGGTFALEGDSFKIQNAIALIDRAISQTLTQKAQTGIYQQSTLETQSSFLSSMESKIAQAKVDYESVDYAAEAVQFSTAQLRVNAAANLLAQANAIPQTLLVLLR